MATPSFLKAPGAIASLIAGFDWSATAIGPLAQWPCSLRTVVGYCVRSSLPVVILWGPRGVMIYNDAYAEFAGDRHPELLGKEVRDGWPEVAQFNDNVMKVGLSGGSLTYQDQELTLHRGDEPEQVWMNLDYAPVLDESGEPAGVMCIVVETTARVIAERQQAQEQALQRRTMQQMPGFVAITSGPDHVFDYVNDSYVAITQRDDLVGKSVREAFPEVEEQGFLELLDRVYRSGEPFSARKTKVHLEGRDTPIFVDLVYHPLRDHRNKVTGIFTGGYETTDVHLASAALERIEARQSLLLALIKGQRETKDPDVIMGAAARAVGEQLEADRVGFFQMSGDTMEFGASWNNGVLEPLDGTLPVSIIGSRYLELVRSGATRGVNDTANDPLTVDSRFGEIGARAIVSAPIFRDGVWIAGLYVDHGSPREWTEDEIALVREVADQTWDAVERARIQNALEESERRLGRALDAGELGVWELDLETHKAWRSLQHDHIFGYDDLLSEWSYEAFLDHIVEEHRSTVDAQFQQAVEQGRWEFEAQIRTAKKDTRWIWGQGVVEYDGEKRPRRMKGMVRDISTRKEIEAQLIDLNEALAERVAERTAERDRLWTLSEDMLARADYEGRLLAVSPSWTRVLGYTEEEFLTRPYAEIIDPQYIDMVTTALLQMRETGQSTRFENRILAKNGEWKPVQWTVSPESDGVHFIAIGRDMTAEKAVDAELEGAREALRHSQKMDAMGQLTGGVAHDFNNLLTPIIGGLDMLQRRIADDPRNARLIEGALKSAERAKILVQRLLAFARRQPLQATAVDIAELMENMVGLLGSTVGPHIEILWEISPDLPPALADGNQIEMALLNLGVNARDAMPEGGTLRMSAEVEDVSGAHRAELSPGRYIRVSVADTGIGMTEETRARAIEPFFSTKGIGKGTGLGLSMVHGLASQLGGGLAIDSTERQGTTIDIWLPVSDRPTQTHQAPDVVPIPMLEGRALLVDDEDLVRKSVAAMLENIGYSVTEADSPEAALRLIEEGFRPHLVVTDYLMPGMNGKELAYAVKARLPGVPVLVVSGYSEVDGIAPELPSLTKPFRMEDLSARIRAIGGMA